MLNDKRIIELHLVITKYCVLSAVSHRSIICLSLSASVNNWSSPHSHITIFSSTLCNCCFNNNCINHQNGKSNFISSCNQAQFCVIFIPLQVIRTPSYFLTLWWWFQRLRGFKLKLFEYLYLAKFYKVWYGLEDKYDQSKVIITN